MSALQTLPRVPLCPTPYIVRPQIEAAGYKREASIIRWSVELNLRWRMTFTKMLEIEHSCMILFSGTKDGTLLLLRASCHQTYFWTQDWPKGNWNRLEKVHWFLGVLKPRSGAGGTAQAPRAHQTTAEDPRSVPRTHIRLCQARLSPAPGDPTPSSGLRKHLHSCAHTHAPNF